MSVLFTRRGATPKLYKAVFADNTWEQIVEICQSGEVPETWGVGDSKTMTINGADYQVDIIGKNHDSYSDGTGFAPLTFQLHDCYGTAYKMNNSNTSVGGWNSSAMRKNHLSAIEALLPAEVRAGLREVNKLTSAGNESTTINTTADKLFLLSEVEICNTDAYAVSGEGVQYTYYAKGNSVLKKLSGSNTNWWTRSPLSGSDASFCNITSGGKIGSASPIYELGIAFAFCF